MKNSILIILLSITVYSCVRKEDKNNSVETINKTTTSEVSKENNVCYQKGKSIFDANCRGCHAPDKKVTANPFQGIRKAYGLDWCVKFINNTDKFIESGDLRANYISLKHNKQLMTKFPQLDKEIINCILEYVDSYPIIDSSYYEHYRMSEAEMKLKIKEFQKH